MIKSEELRAVLTTCKQTSIRTIVDIYIDEQEKKDELLSMYRELHETQDMVTYENVLEQIKALEEEIK